MLTDTPIRKIEDPRLTPEFRRTRNGRTQVFYTGNDSRDWDRYKAEGGGCKPHVEMHDKPDTIHLEPPEKHWYAELIDGEWWWWVNGCAECNGKPRDWMTYIECDVHNRCRTCGKGRHEITEITWGGKHGWQCEPCASAEHEAEKAEALANVPEDFDYLDCSHNDAPVCPRCAYKFDLDSEIYSCVDSEEEMECPRCDEVFMVEGETHVTFTTRLLEKNHD